jgi:hypothetical protein
MAKMTEELHRKVDVKVKQAVRAAVEENVHFSRKQKI